DADACQAERVDDRRDVAGQRRERVVAVGWGGGVAVAALIEGEDPKATGERGRLVVPRPRVTGDAVKEEHRRALGGSPFGQVEALTVHRQRPIGKRGVHRHPSQILTGTWY